MINLAFFVGDDYVPYQDDIYKRVDSPEFLNYFQMMEVDNQSIPQESNENCRKIQLIDLPADVLRDCIIAKVVRGARCMVTVLQHVHRQLGIMAEDAWKKEPTNRLHEGLPVEISCNDFSGKPVIISRCCREQFGRRAGNTVNSAAANGFLNVLKWARANKYSRDGWIYHNAVVNGHLHVLVELNAKLSKNAICLTARNGHLHILKWCLTRDETFIKQTNSTWICAWAARGGHLHVLQWARENGCPWDTETCAQAAVGGHLEVLKWARENGCPWEKSTCEAAVSGGMPNRLDVLRWAIENDCPGREEYIHYLEIKG